MIYCIVIIATFILWFFAIIGLSNINSNGTSGPLGMAFLTTIVAGSFIIINVCMGLSSLIFGQFVIGLITGVIIIMLIWGFITR